MPSIAYTRDSDIGTMTALVFDTLDHIIGYGGRSLSIDTARLAPMLLAVLSMTLVTGCDWYREYRISNTIDSGATKVNSWRHALKLPVTLGTDRMGERPGVELMLGPDSIRAHNLALIRRWVKHDDESRLTPKAVSSRLDFRTGLDFDTDASEGLGNKQLEETLFELYDDATSVRDAIGANGEPEILLTIDERVTFRKVTEVLFAVGQAGFSEHEVLTASADAGDSPSFSDYTRSGLATPTLCGTPADDEKPSPSCVKPGLTRVSDGILLQLTNSTEWTDGPNCLTADKASDQSSTSSKDEPDSREAGESNQKHRDYVDVTDAPIRSPDGDCPIPTGHGTRTIIATLTHIDTHANLCSQATVSATSEIRWGRIAPVIPAMQRRTPVEYVTLSRPAQTLPTCDDAVSPSDIFDS